MNKKETPNDFTDEKIIEKLKQQMDLPKRIPNSYFKLEKTQFGSGEITFKLKVRKEKIEKIIENVSEDLKALTELINNKNLQ